MRLGQKTSQYFDENLFYFLKAYFLPAVASAETAIATSLLISHIRVRIECSVISSRCVVKPGN